MSVSNSIDFLLRLQSAKKIIIGLFSAAMIMSLLLILNMNYPTEVVTTHNAKVYAAYKRVMPARQSSADSHIGTEIIVELNNGQKLTIRTFEDTPNLVSGDLVKVRKIKRKFWGYVYRYDGKIKI